MGRSPCCDKVGLKKGPWTPEEDHKLLAYIQEHGHGSWRALPTKAGLQRCGKSCRLRWTNYLRPDIKRGKFSLQEEQTIIQLHALLGNRWSAIATHLPKRTDNEIKNYWNTHLKKRLAKMGIDPVTHKPKNDALLSSDGQSKHAANLSHMAQWESARLEAEARLARQSSSFQNHHPLGSQPMGLGPTSRYFDVQKTWNTMWARREPAHSSGEVSVAGIGESPTSSLSYSENQHSGIGENSTTAIMEEENCNNNLCGYKDGNIENSLSFTSGLREFATPPMDNTSWAPEQLQPNYSEGSDKGGTGSGTEYFEDNKNYWNSILNVVNSSPVFEWEFS